MSQPIPWEQQSPQTRYETINNWLTAVAPDPIWYWESDGDEHARTFYVIHTRITARFECRSRREARALVRELNEAANKVIQSIIKIHESCTDVEGVCESRGLQVSGLR